MKKQKKVLFRLGEIQKTRAKYFSMIGTDLNSYYLLSPYNPQPVKEEFLLNHDSNKILLTRELKKNTVYKEYFDTPRSLSFEINLIVFLFKVSPEIIVSFAFSINTIICMLYAKLFGKKIILIGLGGERFGGGKLRYLLRKLIINNSNGIIALSSETERYVRKYFNNKNVLKIVNPINVIEYKQKKTYKIIQSNPVKILYVGEISIRKGISQLLHSLEKLNFRYTNWIIDFYGKVKTDLNISEDIDKKIFFKGIKSHAELVNTYCEYDIFVFPSLADTFGLVCFEAMAAGLPIICSKYADCISDLIVDEENGFIIDPYDSEDFSEKLYLICSNEVLRKKFGKKAIEIASKYNLAKQVEQTKIYLNEF